MTTKIKEKTMIECLKNFSQQEINQMYNKIKMALQEPKKNPTKEEKLEIIHEKIITSFMFFSMAFSDEDMKQLQNLIDGKKVKDINEQFLQENFVFEENNEYIVPKEIKELYLQTQTEDMQKEKYLLMISFYMEINGVLTITKLKELINNSGLSITKEKLLECLKEKELIVQKNKIYLNEVAKILDESADLYNLKKESEFAIYSPMEALALVAIRDEANYVEQLQKQLSKKIKNKNKLFDISYGIFNTIRIGFDCEKNIMDILEQENITFTPEEQLKFDELIEEIIHNQPSWINNGYVGCEHDDCIDHDIDFEELTEEEKVTVYTNAYLNMNGVLEIETFRNILAVHHGISFSKQKLVKNIKDSEIATINGQYICVDGLGQEEIQELMTYKNAVGKYKIIENIDRYLEEFEEIEDQLEFTFQKYNLNNEVSSTLVSAMYFGGITEEMLFSVLEFFHVKMLEKKKKQLLKELESISKNIRIWALNGHKIHELSSSQPKEKIGRNESCPCGSGKKYKQCCGK